MEEKGLFQYFKECYTKNYANFEGRARRKEYWGFILFFMVIYFALFVIMSVTQTPAIGILIILFYLGSFIPIIAVTCRRMHDTGKSGWFQLIPIYGFVLTFLDGDQGSNEFGADAKNPTEGNEVEQIGTE
ncbi:MAG: uncharacterized membrane protein YhaH (DUF805 family) [Bacteroidia bacterium]|jgi:uncharacterized membrane protein YhaH (DUF805 family)